MVHNNTAVLTGLFMAASLLVVPLKLSGDMPLNGGVKDIYLSPDGKVAVYSAIQLTSSVELYSSPLQTGAPIRISTPLSNSTISFVSITPDSQKVAYQQCTAASGCILYGSPITSSTAVSLGLYPGEWHMAGDSQHVVYESRWSNPQYDLVSADIDTGAQYPLSDVSSGKEMYFGITPDGSHVAIGVNPSGQSKYPADTLRSISITGTEDVLLDNRGIMNDIKFTPDSQKVVYRTYHTLWPNSVGAIGGLFQTSLHGGTPITLVEPSNYVGYFQLSPDGQLVVFYGTVTFTNTTTLQGMFSVPINGGTITPLTDYMDDQFYGPYCISITPDNKWVVFVSWFNAQQVNFKLWAASLTSKQLYIASDSFSPASGSNCKFLALSADSQWLAYALPQTDGTKFSLFSHRLGSTETHPIAGDQSLGTWIDAFKLTNDGNAVYREGLANGEVRVRSTSIKRGPVIDLSNPGTLPGMSCQVAQYIPCGPPIAVNVLNDTVLYRHDPDTGGLLELYTTGIPVLGNTLYLPQAMR